MKKILLIATGGTLASSKTEKGLKPTLDIHSILKYLPKSVYNKCTIEGISLFCIDSSDMNSDFVLKIANEIYENYEKYDSFIIIHGTDTMAYTSALLSYMFENLSKSILLTGSQIPIESPNNDAIQNLSDSICFAQEDFSGVAIVFGKKVIDGKRAYKKKSQSFDAFDSLNAPFIAHIDKDKVTYQIEKSQKSNQTLIFKNKLEKQVILVKLFPNISQSIFDKITSEGKAIVIEGFGVGNIPNHIRKVIKEILEKDKMVIITTQCLLEGVVPKKYSAGNISDQIIYLQNTHSEAIMAKCQVGLGYYKTKKETIEFLNS